MELLCYAHRPRSIVLQLIDSFPLMTRERERSPDVSFAQRVSRPTRHTFSCVAERHLPGCISPEDLFARGGRCARASGLATTGPCRTSSMRGEFITRCTTRCALHGRHRKSVWEVVQAFGRAVSAKSYNFDGSTAFVGEPAPVASRLQRRIAGNFIHQRDRIPACHVCPNVTV